MVFRRHVTVKRPHKSCTNATNHCLHWIENKFSAFEGNAMRMPGTYMRDESSWCHFDVRRALIVVVLAGCGTLYDVMNACSLPFRTITIYTCRRNAHIIIFVRIRQYDGVKYKVKSDINNGRINSKFYFYFNTIFDVLINCFIPIDCCNRN